MRAAVVGLVLLGACLSGCVTRREGLDLTTFYDSFNKPVTEPGASVMPAAQRGVFAPGTVVVARVAAQPYDARTDPSSSERGGERIGKSEQRSYFEARSWNPDTKAAWLIDEGLTSRQSDALDRVGRRVRVVHGSSLFQTPIRVTTDDLLQRAAAGGADWLCVFSSHSTYKALGGDPTLGLQLLTLGLFPTISDAKAQVDMLLIDIRDGKVVDRWTAEETGWQPAIGWTQNAASEQSADRAETRVVKRVLERLESKLPQTDKR